MRKFPIVLDLETKYTFRDYADQKKLGVSVVGIFDYRHNQNNVFREEQLSDLFPLLESSSYIIGYNINSFDLPVLQAYYPGRLEHFSTFDILEDIKKKIGKRLALNDVVFATLGKRKTGHGLQAIELYKEKRWEELKKYCLADVALTKELFEFGVEKGEIFYLNEKGKVAIKVDWKKYLTDPGRSESHLTLPF